MAGVADRSLAQQFDFEEAAQGAVGPSRLRLAPAPRLLHGPDKYKVLAHRLHQAQIKARRVLAQANEEIV